MDTTYEEARRCSRCGDPGRLVRKDRMQDRSGKLHVLTCDNKRCRRYQTNWLIQVNPDGTIPPPITDREKRFRPLPKRRSEDVQEALDRQLAAELTKNSEVRK
jgi:hypothetical protein